MDLPLDLFDIPAGQRVQGWRARGLAGGEREAGVVQGTTDLPLDHDALGERAAVVSAAGAHGERSSILANQQDEIVCHLAHQGLAFN
jgi:hypothetical protein